MTKYQAGDYIKAEFRDEESGESEWMWVRIESCDDDKQIVFGSLDSAPLFGSSRGLALGSKLAVSYSSIREHRRSAEFNVQ
jgi:hypothetical protein